MVSDRTEVPQTDRSPWVTILPVVIVVFIGACLRVYRIGSQPLSLDEAESLRFARESLPSLWSWSHLADSGNPPLYYTLLHGWLIFGDGESSLRSLSAIIGVTTIPVVYALGRTVRDHLLGIVAALLFALSPSQVWYSQDARAYSLLAFGATLAMVGIAYLIRHPERSGDLPGTAVRARWKGRGAGTSRGATPSPVTDIAWLTYIIGTAIALLAHNTAVLLPLGANALMIGWWLVRKREPLGFLRSWLLAQTIVLLLWTSWLPAYVKQLHGSAYSWIPEPRLHTVLLSAYDVYAGVTRATPFLIEALLIIVLVGLGIWSWRRDLRWVAFVVVIGLAAPVGELIVSTWRPVFLERTLIWAAVPLCLIIAAGVLSSRSRVFAAAVLAVLVLLAGSGLRSYYFLLHKEAWDKAAEYVDGRAQPGDVIFFVASYVQVPFDYYNVPPPFPVDEIGVARTQQGLSLMLDELKKHRRVWLIVSHAAGNEASFSVALSRIGQMIDSVRVTGVDVYLFMIRGEGAPA